MRITKSLQRSLKQNKLKNLNEKSAKMLLDILDGVVEMPSTYPVQSTRDRKVSVVRLPLHDGDRLLMWKIGSEKVAFFAGHHKEADAKCKDPPPAPDETDIVEWSPSIAATHADSASVPAAPNHAVRPSLSPAEGLAVKGHVGLATAVIEAMDQLAKQLVAERSEHDMIAIAQMVVDDSAVKLLENFEDLEKAVGDEIENLAHTKDEQGARIDYLENLITQITADQVQLGEQVEAQLGGVGRRSDELRRGMQTGFAGLQEANKRNELKIAQIVAYFAKVQRFSARVDGKFARQEAEKAELTAMLSSRMEASVAATFAETREQVERLEMQLEQMAHREQQLLARLEELERPTWLARSCSWLLGYVLGNREAKLRPISE